MLIRGSENGSVGSKGVRHTVSGSTRSPAGGGLSKPPRCCIGLEPPTPSKLGSTILFKRRKGVGGRTYWHRSLRFHCLNGPSVDLIERLCGEVALPSNRRGLHWSTLDLPRIDASAERTTSFCFVGANLPRHLRVVFYALADATSSRYSSKDCMEAADFVGSS